MASPAAECSVKPAKIKPLKLDLGACTVTVEFTEMHDDSIGRAVYADRRIILDPARIGEQNLTTVLMHECLHHLDDMYLGGALTKNGGNADEHVNLDVLARVLDMMLRLNFQTFATFYEDR